MEISHMNDIVYIIVEGTLSSDGIKESRVIRKASDRLKGFVYIESREYPLQLGHNVFYCKDEALIRVKNMILGRRKAINREMIRLAEIETAIKRRELTW